MPKTKEKTSKISRSESKVPGILADIDWGRNPGFLISDLQRLIGIAVDEGLKSVDLTNAQLRVILHLNQLNGATQVQLADEIGVKKASLGVLLERLEDKGLIERRPHSTDRRANLIFLSDKASSHFRSIFSMGTDVMNGLMKDISREEQEQLITLLLRVKANAIEAIQDSKEK